MPDILDEALAPSRGATQIPRSKAKTGVTFASSGKLLCFLFALTICLNFVDANSFLSLHTAVLYSASTEAPGKRVASPARPCEIALSELSDGALVAELRLCLHRGKEAARFLAECELRSTKLGKDLVAMEEANARLQSEVERFKESAA